MRFHKIIILLAVFAVIPAIAAATSYNLCREDHIPPPNKLPLADKIGEIAGFQILGLFLSQGGFGCPSQVMDQIRQISDAYRENEYLPRYEEAFAIQTWLNATHDVYAPPTAPYDCPVCGFPHDRAEFTALALEKATRRNEISLEIDTIWVNAALDAWDLIPADSQDAYLVWFDALSANP